MLFETGKPISKKMNGIIFVGYGTGTYSTPSSDQSLKQLAATGASWVRYAN